MFKNRLLLCQFHSKNISSKIVLILWLSAHFGLVRVRITYREQCKEKVKNNEAENLSMSLHNIFFKTLSNVTQTI